MMHLFKSLFGGTKTGQLAGARARGSVLIDVRTPAEFARGHTEGAINIPDYYNRKILEGKPKLVALNGVRNKLLSRVFAAVQRGTPYIKNQVEYL